MSLRQRFLWVVLFAIAFAWVEASVVVYLRDLYYPAGFAFPLKVFPQGRLSVELIREFSTLAMLAAVGMLAGSTRWQRFAWIMITFGVWDIGFYACLKVAIDWPSSFLDWDILFLLPLPWIGPVVAPALISIFLIVAGLVILRVESQRPFRPGVLPWVFALGACAMLLWSFMRDTNATLHGSMPERYSYEALVAAVICCAVGLLLAAKNARGSAPQPSEDTIFPE